MFRKSPADSGNKFPYGSSSTEIEGKETSASAEGRAKRSVWLKERTALKQSGRNAEQKDGSWLELDGCQSYSRKALLPSWSNCFSLLMLYLLICY